MADERSETVHATCVAIGGMGVLIEGPPGAGKSDLALRLIDRGAVLVSDDYTVVSGSGDGLIAAAPERIAGRIEARGIGILDTPHIDTAPVRLMVRADPSPARLPEARTRSIAGGKLPEIALSLLEASAPIKVELALARLTR